jgi:hypothetical protein
VALKLTTGPWTRCCAPRWLHRHAYVPVAPGLAFDDPHYPPTPDAMRVIRGTSDAVVGPEGARLHRVATAYAERYNRLLLANVGQLGKVARPPAS